MELLFLALLLVIMAFALGSGYPVAFALPGAAIISIALAALSGWLFAGDTDAYFAQGGPGQWLSAGVTNLRGVYWDVDRDTLIAIPLFVFMGIMLQRSKIAEDLLVTMAQLFGPVPGGLGISVVFVGALLAATTGIVGATVVAMGLISLPAMLRNNYSKPLATGTIAASGTLGQIIPPSIVLIILADQLASGADQASTIRTTLYKDATGEISMPSAFGVTSTSAGEMFLGALVPGLVLVGLYMAYILIFALVRPQAAPAVRREDDSGFDAAFLWRLFIVLVPPLALIFLVLGSIILGVATVNQAGAIGAAGALVMAGYKLTEGRRSAYVPAILAVGAIVVLTFTISTFDTNIKSPTRDEAGILIALVATAVLLVALAWSAWRAYRIEDTLTGVMIETAKTTSLVFIILLGAAMLTAAFRAFGGEELVKEFLEGLPGGFWTKFVIVMAVIFVLGFFLDFIEIAVVVVPIVAPILLADPGANITAVWLGVMIGLNIQTSFLTPPFGFALFYLRGVAPAIVKTLDMYKGVIAFIALQLGALAIVGSYPPLVNYLPNRVSLLSETAPPPRNPQLQYCLENYVFEKVTEDRAVLDASIARVRALDLSALPEGLRDDLTGSLDDVGEAIDLLAQAKVAEAEVERAAEGYRPLHREVRQLQADARQLAREAQTLRTRIGRQRRAGADAETLERMEERAAEFDREREAVLARLPAGWEERRAAFREVADREEELRNQYRRTADRAYEAVKEAADTLKGTPALRALQDEFTALRERIATGDPKETQQLVQDFRGRLGDVEGASKIRSELNAARRALRKRGGADLEKALEEFDQAAALFAKQLEWRAAAEGEITQTVIGYETTLRDTVGVRQQPGLTREQALFLARCQSDHRDISLSF